jgi:pyruvate kinase
VAKIERPAAVERLEEILEASDAVMVARGDLGIELPLERVPRVQKEITRRARAKGLPVIVATEVLESMRTAVRPTRAEVSDAANAVEDLVDAIMLAAETAVGAHPVEAVRTLDAVIRDAETILPDPGSPGPGVDPTRTGHGRALGEAAVTLARRGHADAIVAVTREGKTARLLAALRPPAPIYAVTPAPTVARRLALYWGVAPITGAAESPDAIVRDRLPAGAVAVFLSVNPDLARRDANFLAIRRLSG